MSNGPDERKSTETEIDRRDILKGVGVAGGVVGASGILWFGTRGRSTDNPPEEPSTDDSNTAEVQPPPFGGSDSDADSEDDTDDGSGGDPIEPENNIPHADSFETVVDVIETDADPTGEEPINFLFEEYTDDSTLFAFDPGTYLYDPLAIEDRSEIGFISIEDEAARLVPNEEGCRGGHPYFHLDDVSDLLLDNIDFDFRDVDSGGPLHLFLHGDSMIRDVTYRGSCSNQLGIARIDVVDADGAALIENFEATNVDENNDLTGVYVSDNHAGELTFRDCQLDNFADNGLYASAPGSADGQDGTVNVVGGSYSNNNIANVRLGSTDAIAEDVTVRVDSETPGWGQLNARGIRLRNRANQVIRNCDITFTENAADSFGAVVFHRANGGALVVNTEIQIDRDDIPAIRAFAPDGAPDTAPVFEDLTITGDATAGLTADIEGRDGTVFRNCVIEGTGERAGIEIRSARDCRIVDSTIDVGTDPLRLRNASATIENTTVITPDGEREIGELTLEDELLTIE